MKKVTLFGLIALIVLAIALPASAALKLTGSYTHTLNYGDKDITSDYRVTSQMVLLIDSILPDSASEEGAKLYITIPLKLTFNAEKHSLLGLDTNSNGSDKTWRIGYESPVFSITVSNASGDFGSFKDPMGIANSALNLDIQSAVEYGHIVNINNAVRGAIINEDVTVEEFMTEIAEVHSEAITKSMNDLGRLSSSIGSYISINTWGKIGSIGYDLSIVDATSVKITETELNSDGSTFYDSLYQTKTSSFTDSVTSTALRLTYDINNALTIGVTGIVSNQFVINSVAVTNWNYTLIDGLTHTLGDQKIEAGIRELIYTLSADASYNLSGKTGGSAFGQVAISASSYGEYKDNVILPSIEKREGSFNGVGFALGVKDMNLGSIKFGATFAMTTPSTKASNISFASINPSSWSSKYLPEDVNTEVARNTRYGLVFDESASLFLPNSMVIIAKASGSWTLNNKALLEVTAKNGLNMFMNPIEALDLAQEDSTIFINNLLQLSGNYYIYGENAEGKELAKGSKNLVKAGLYFDPRFVNVVDGHVNHSFNFATRGYVGVDFKTLGLQFDVDIRYTNHIQHALELALWTKYSTSFNITPSFNVSTDIAAGYRYLDAFQKKDNEKYNATHQIYGYIGGSTILSNGIEIALYDAIKVESGANLRNRLGEFVVPFTDILNVIRLTASKELSSIYTLSVGVTNKAWYNNDRGIYFESGKEARMNDRPAKQTQFKTYMNATLTAKVSPTATITITYGSTGLSSLSGFSSGKLWAAALGANNDSEKLYSEDLNASYKPGGLETIDNIDKVDSRDTFNKLTLKEMIWDKFSIEFKFTF